MGSANWNQRGSGGRWVGEFVRGPGTIAFWAEHVTQHCAVGDEHGRRIVHRVSIRGETPARGASDPRKGKVITREPTMASTRAGGKPHSADGSACPKEVKPTIA